MTTFNRQMRRELAKRELPKKKSEITRQYTLSDASRLKEIDLGKARRDGRIEGMDRMYQLVILAVSKIKGIGPVRQKQIKESILDQIIQIGKENGVILDGGFLDSTETDSRPNQQAAAVR